MAGRTQGSALPGEGGHPGERRGRRLPPRPPWSRSPRSTPSRGRVDRRPCSTGQEPGNSGHRIARHRLAGRCPGIPSTISWIQANARIKIADLAAHTSRAPEPTRNRVEPRFGTQAPPARSGRLLLAGRPDSDWPGTTVGARHDAKRPSARHRRYHGQLASASSGHSGTTVPEGRCSGGPKENRICA